MGKLDNKVALVTGAANGIGKAASLVLAAEGAKVACAALMLGEDEAKGNKSLVPSSSPVFIPRIYGESLGQVVSEIQAAGGTAVGIQADITDEDSCDYLLWNTRHTFGPVDVLVHTAVLNYGLPTVEFPTKWWFQCWAVLVHAAFMLSKKVLPSMMYRHSGAIININSRAAIGPGRGPYDKHTGSGGVMYGSAKAAIERFTQGLAQEVYRYGITVAAVCPSHTVRSPGAEYLKIMRAPDEWEPAEMMAKAILLLATEPLDKITGRVTYSQAILQEFGWIEKGKGIGIDSLGSGFSQI